MKRPLIIIAFCFIAQLGLAQNKNIIRTGEKTFSVGLYAKPFRFERINYNGTQNALFWDWATCLVMCLNYNGLNVSQEQMMTLVNGSVEEPFGAPQDLTFAVNKNTPTAWGKPSKVFCAAANLNADVLFDELSADRPIIIGTGNVGLEGRAYVVTAMAYTIKFDANGQQVGIVPTSVTLRDPWPNSFANRIVQWSDFMTLTASLYTLKVEFKKQG